MGEEVEGVRMDCCVDYGEGCDEAAQHGGGNMREEQKIGKVRQLHGNMYAMTTSLTMNEYAKI